MLTLRVDEIGGGRVRRIFSLGGKKLVSGTALSAETIAAMPASNRNSLIENGFIQVWPKAGTHAAERTERHVVSRGFGKFDVIEGRVLNEAPLTKEEAEKLAGTEDKAR